MRRFVVLALLFPLALLSSCFEDPVEQQLTVELLPGRHAIITVRLAIHDAGQSGSPLVKRLEEVRREWLEAGDEWTPRFAAAAPVAERFGWEKQLGDLHTAVHSAMVDQPESLGRFLADTGVGVSWTEEEARGEVMFFPSSPARASAREFASMQTALANWSREIAAYTAATQALYRYLERRPGRAEACLGRLLREDLADGRAALLPATTADEDRLLDAVHDAMGRVAEVLLVPDGEAESLQELSHRIYDPFPAAITLRLPAPAIEVEGFVGTPNAKRTLRIARAGLWESLGRLRGRWLAPDPLLLDIAHQQAPETPLDLPAVLAVSRRASAPSAGEVERALVLELAPKPSYRAAWSTAGLKDDDDSLRAVWRADSRQVD